MMHNPSLKKLATPVHIFYRDRVKQDAEAIKTGLSQSLNSLDLIFSVKTNPLPELLRLLSALGWQMEVVSPGDLAATQKACIPGAQLILSGAGWKLDFLKSAIHDNNVRSFVLDSPGSAQLLAQALKPIANDDPLTILLRLNDGDSHFGVHPSAETFRLMLEPFQRFSSLEIGLHIHKNSHGSPENEQQVIRDFRDRLQVLTVAKNLLEKSVDQPVLIFNLGGGIDSPFTYNLPPAKIGDYHNPSRAPKFRALIEDSRFSLEHLAGNISAEIAKALVPQNTSSVRIQFELGRSVSARALSTLITVLNVKNSLYPDAVIAITDGNTATMGPIQRCLHPIHAFTKNSSTNCPHFIYGNLPHSGDWLFQNLDLPTLTVGDQILIEHTGAYLLPLEAEFGFSLPAIYDLENETYLRQG